MSEYQAKV